ncbi:acyl-CoA thioesterase [Massiliimalia massiliensis]|uniref:acyl-CoA thioesterase n=1 Tax=Massiliimalia massiliensis TaxID=1852384 RepID=UPI000986F9FA|nr:acyl-CoA thioesterase [Massiliimalia massiliensis]
MAELEAKYVADSRTEQTQMVLSEHINGYNRLFGGKLMEWIDVVAGVVARRHSNRNVTTVCIDKLHFKAPAHVNDIVVLNGKITYVGRTSMEVRVDTFVEDLDGYKRPINHAYLVLVAIDEQERPVPVPGLLLTNEQEKAEWEAGMKRSELRKQRRKDFF